jgi:hypothetical protein
MSIFARRVCLALVLTLVMAGVCLTNVGLAMALWGSDWRVALVAVGNAVLWMSFASGFDPWLTVGRRLDWRARAEALEELAYESSPGAQELRHAAAEWEADEPRRKRFLVSPLPSFKR